MKTIIETKAGDVTLKVLHVEEKFCLVATDYKGEEFVRKTYDFLNDAIDVLALFLKDEYAVSAYA